MKRTIMKQLIVGLLLLMPSALMAQTRRIPQVTIYGKRPMKEIGMQKTQMDSTALKENIARDKLDTREAALASRLVYSVQQNKILLDFYLSAFLQGKLKNLQPIVLDILRLGAAQILYFDKIPDSAAVNESVTLTKKYNKNPKAASLVNGVLRNAVRSQGQLKEPVSYADKYSHPEELISLLKSNLPKGKLEPMLIADNASPETVVQVNTRKITADQLMLRLEQERVTAVPHRWMKDCLVLSGTGNLEQLPSFKEGLFYVQDPAAKLSVLCAKLPQEDIRLLDCCSAPGGKSFAAAIAMGGHGRITSCDVHAHKIGIIENGAARLGLDNITARQQDATIRVPEWEEQMDAVIADVPCSGLGIIRKKPDIRYKALEGMKDLPALQMAILENQSAYVKKVVVKLAELYDREIGEVEQQTTQNALKVFKISE